MQDFFWDAPWLRVPPYRKAEIRIEPRFPRLGLLGGSSQGQTKVSKIAALAAKRRQAEDEKRGARLDAGNKDIEASTAGIERLRLTTKHISASRGSLASRPPAEAPMPQGSKSREPDSRTAQTQAASTHTFVSSGQQEYAEVSDISDLQGAPSAFARTLLAPKFDAFAVPSKDLPLHIFQPDLSLFNFSKPSPDDVVLKAQNWKGPH